MGCNITDFSVSLEDSNLYLQCPDTQEGLGCCFTQHQNLDFQNLGLGNLVKSNQNVHNWALNSEYSLPARRDLDKNILKDVAKLFKEEPRAPGGNPGIFLGFFSPERARGILSLLTALQKHFTFFFLPSAFQNLDELNFQR